MDKAEHVFYKVAGIFSGMFEPSTDTLIKNDIEDLNNLKGLSSKEKRDYLNKAKAYHSLRAGLMATSENSPEEKAFLQANKAELDRRYLDLYGTKYTLGKKLGLVED